MTILEFQDKKRRGEKISMLTCYDSSFARLIDQTPIDAVLVGDSLAMTMHGYETTINASLEMMTLHTGAVARNMKKKLVVADLPFLSNRRSMDRNVDAVEALMKAGAHAVKLEGADGNLELIHHLVQSGVPVMGHLGLTPQSVHQLGGFKVQGREKTAQETLKRQALELQQAGCFSVVFECVPSALASEVSRSLQIPVIGIGAGIDVDGQVLVLQDMLGMSEGFKPKFLRTYFNGAEEFKNAFTAYHNDVVSGAFPAPKESYE